MKKIIKLKIRNAEGVLVSNDLVSCSIEEAYKKEKVTLFNKQGKCWRCLVNIKPDDEDCDDMQVIHYQDVFNTMQGALAAANNFLNEWFEGYRATTM